MEAQISAATWMLLLVPLLGVVVLSALGLMKKPAAAERAEAAKPSGIEGAQ